jgi:hypothetical protein
MNKGSSGIYDRCLEKTAEQLFVGTLRREFELSPAASLGILEAAKTHLFSTLPESIGKVQFICASINARHGRPLRDQEKVTVNLTLDGGIEDLEVAKTQGVVALRQYRILRLTEEAYDQGGILTQEDLGRLLHVSSRTIRSDIQELIKDENTVHTRGYDHDIGRSLSHKAHIIDLHLSGYTYADIIRRTRHSGHNIKRYILSFGRLLLLKNRGIDELNQLSRLLNQSSRLTEEYLKLFEKYLVGDHWPSSYIELLEQLQALYPAKKKRRGN